MKRTIQRAWLTGIMAVTCLSAAQVLAQPAPGGGGPGGPGGGPGNFDPAQMRQRMMDRYREQMGVKSDDEWKIIQERVEQVMDARRAVGFGGMGGMRGFGRGGQGQGQGQGQAQADNTNRRQRFGPEPTPEQEALQQAVDSNASNDQLKSLLAKYREARKANEAKLQQAQDNLRKILSMRQEAVAVLMGLLN
jgi:hypothetical protein